mgnify:CR=1 FL=1
MWEDERVSDWIHALLGVQNYILPQKKGEKRKTEWRGQDENRRQTWKLETYINGRCIIKKKKYMGCEKNR